MITSFRYSQEPFVMQQLSYNVAAAKRPPRAPPDVDVEMEGDGLNFDYGSNASVSRGPQARCSVQPPPARAPRASSAPGGAPVIASGVGALLELRD